MHLRNRNEHFCLHYMCILIAVYQSAFAGKQSKYTHYSKTPPKIIKKFFDLLTLSVIIPEFYDSSVCPQYSLVLVYSIWGWGGLPIIPFL